MFTILIIQIYCNFIIAEFPSPYSSHLQPFSLSRRGGNSEFEFDKNIKDRFNGIYNTWIIYMDHNPCITYSVVLYAFLWRWQILLTFSRHQVIYNVFCITPCVEVTYKDTFSYSNKAKVNTRSSHPEIFLRIVNLLHIFRTPFPRNTSVWLLLQFLITFNITLDLCFISELTMKIYSILLN